MPRIPRSRTVVTETETEARERPIFAPGEPATPRASRVWWDYLDSELGQRDWATDGIKVYLYRISKDPEKLGREGYLVRFEKPFDAEELRTLPGVGGGTYTCHVKQGSTRIYVSAPFDIDGPPNPWPATAPGASGGAGSTDTAALQLLKPLVEQAAGQVAGGVDLKTAVANVLDMQTTAFKATLASIAGAGGAGGDSLERAAGLFQKMGLLRAPGDGDGFNLERAAEMFAKLGLIKPPRSLGDEIADVLAITERLGLGGRRGGGSDWAGVARELAPKFLDTGARVVSDLRRITELRVAAGGVPSRSAPANLRGRLDHHANPPIPSAGAAATQPASAADAGAVAPGVAGNGGPASASTSPVAPAQPTLTAWEWVKHGARRRISGGGSPEDLAEYLDVVSPELFDSLAGLSVEALESLFDSDDILRESVFASKWGSRREFFERFLALAGETETEPEPAETEPAGAGRMV